MSIFETAPFWCFVLLLTTIIVVLVISWVNININKYCIPDKRKNCSGLIVAAQHYNEWRNLSILWLALEYLLMIVPFELTAFVLYLEVFPDVSYGTTKPFVFIFSVLSMLLIILNHVLHPNSQAKLYRLALMEIHHIIFVDECPDPAAIYSAIRKGEEIISRVYDL